MNLFKEIDRIDKDKYILATYFLHAKTTLRDAAWELAVGQSVGNPHVRNHWESDQLFEDHSCIILNDPGVLSKSKLGHVLIGFPVANTDFEEDGISHLLCQLMGGQMDISNILSCRLINLVIPQHVRNQFKGPKYGIKGIREFTKVKDKPLLGGIIKPKIGVSPKILCQMVQELVEGGVNFIKEDEIMANPACCRLTNRVPYVMDFLNEYYPEVIYSVCINGDPHSVLKKAEMVHRLGGNSVHANIWCGLGVYNSLRKLDLPLFIHFQKSGDKVITFSDHDFSITWPVLCQLVGLSGADFAHAGMIGGYANDDTDEILDSIHALRNEGTLPALSCGMHPGLVNKVTSVVGNDYMANVGGAIHGHPRGTKSGAIAMRQAIDGNLDEPEYKEAIEKWGLCS